MSDTAEHLSWLAKRDADTGLPIIRVWEDWCSSGLWNSNTLTSVAVGLMIDVEDLELPADLSSALAAWQHTFDAGNSEVDRSSEFWATFDAEKLRLTLALSAHLGARALVECEIGARGVVCLHGAPLRIVEMEATAL